MIYIIPGYTEHSGLIFREHSGTWTWKWMCHDLKSGVQWNTVYTSVQVRQQQN